MILPARQRGAILVATKQLEGYFARLPIEQPGLCLEPDLWQAQVTGKHDRDSLFCRAVGHFEAEAQTGLQGIFDVPVRARRPESEQIGDLGDIGFPSAFPKPTPCPGQCRLAIAWASQGSSWDTSAKAPHGATRSPCWRRSWVDRALAWSVSGSPVFHVEAYGDCFAFWRSNFGPSHTKVLGVRDAEQCCDALLGRLLPRASAGILSAQYHTLIFLHLKVMQKDHPK